MPLQIEAPLGLYLEIALKYKVKQSENGKFPSNYKASPINFEHQFPFVDKPPLNITPPKISPSKRAFENYKPLGLFSEFYGNLPTTAEESHLPFVVTLTGVA